MPHSTISDTQPLRKRSAMQCMSPLLAQAWLLMDVPQQELAAAMHEHYEREFVRVGREADNPESVAASVHMALDEMIADAAVKDAGQFAQVQCRDGCAHCCKQNVTVSKPEAALLLACAQEKGYSVDWQRVKRQASHAGPVKWVTQPVADMACVFLGADNRCAVYEHRPSACRRHFAVSDPAQCDIVRNPGTQVLYWAPTSVEVMASAALLAFECGSMPVMLQRAKKEGAT